MYDKNTVQRKSSDPQSLLQRAQVAFATGSQCFSQGHYRQAAAMYIHALTLYQAFPNTQHQVANCLHNLATVLHKINELPAACTYHTQELFLLRALPNTDFRQASCLFSLGNTLQELGANKDAIETFTRAFNLYKTISGTEKHQAECLNNLGALSTTQHDYRNATNFLTQALVKYQAVPNAKLDRAHCHNNLGVLLYLLGDSKNASGHFAQALALYQVLPNREKDQADCLYHLGVTMAFVGETFRALPHFTEALSIYETLPNSERERANCLHNLGGAEYEQGKHADAIEHYYQALTLYTTLKGVEKEHAICLLNFSSRLRLMEQLDEAQCYLTLATKLAELANDPRLTDDINLERSFLQRTLAFKADPPDMAALNEAFERVLPIAIRHDEERFKLDSAFQRAQWIENIAYQRANFALLLARETKRPTVIAELVAKWRLSGTIESRTLETNLPIPTEQPTEQNNGTTTSPDTNTHTKHNTEPEQPPLVITQDAGLVAGETLPLRQPPHARHDNVTEHVTTRRTPGPLLRMPYGNRCEITKYTPNAETRTHARYR